MNILHYTQLQQFLSSFSRIKRTMSEWRLAELSLSQKNANIHDVALKLQEFFKAREGTVFICNHYELIALIRTGSNITSAALCGEIRDSVKEYDCFVTAEEITDIGLGKIVLQIVDKTKDQALIMIADDDMFMRSLASQALQQYGKIVEFADGTQIADSYKKLRPDVVFLDIHMPGRSGMEVLKDIMKIDPKACVIMISADSIKDNILEAQKIGAKSFITKPFTKSMVQTKYHQALA